MPPWADGQDGPFSPPGPVASARRIKAATGRRFLWFFLLGEQKKEQFAHRVSIYCVVGHSTYKEYAFMPFALYLGTL